MDLYSFAVRPARARSFVLASVLWGLVACAPVSAGVFGDPPWAVESPGAVDAKLGLGLEYLFERQDHLDIRSTRTVVTLRDLDRGIISTTIQNGDPALLQRKFDIEWRSQGPGAVVPIRLPHFSLSSFHLPGGGGVYSSLILEASTADATLDFHDKPEPANSDSLTGRGPMFGLGLNLVASLCAHCPWYSGVGYRWRNLPRFTVARSPRFAAPGFDVLRDEVRLSRKSQSFSTWVGYTSPGNRVAAYAGVRRLTADIDVLDELRLGSQAERQETTLSSRSKYASSGTEKVLGIDAHLWGPFFARSEFAFGDRQREGSIAIVYLLARAPAIDNPAAKSPSEARRRENREREQRARAIAADLAVQLERILSEFSAARDNLPVVHLGPGVDAYPRQPILDLLSRTERELLVALSPPELIAMRDYVRDLFEQARAALDLEGPTATSQHRSRNAVVPVRRLAGAEPLTVAPARDGDVLDKRPVDSWTGTILEAIRQMWIEATKNDLLVTLCIKSFPQKKARFMMHPLSYTPPDMPEADTDFQLVDVWRGLYVYEVHLRGFKRITGRLGLVTDSRPIIKCPLIPETDAADVLLCKRSSGDVAKECPDHGE
jgi:hypothetical protein